MFFLRSESCDHNGQQLCVLTQNDWLGLSIKGETGFYCLFRSHWTVTEIPLAALRAMRDIVIWASE